MGEEARRPGAARRRWGYRRVVRGAAIVILALSVADHAGAFGYRGNDAARVDGRAFLVTGVEGPLTLGLRGEDGATIRARLLGVAGPGDEDANARTCGALLAEELRRQIGTSVLVRLEVPPRREADGAVAAYLWPRDREMLNEMLVREGWGLADDGAYVYAGDFEVAQREARRKRSGLWSMMSEYELPGGRGE